MRKIFLCITLMYLSLVACFAQADFSDSTYHSRKLRFDEVNLVSGYYTQDGNNSAVTGGTGTEQLTDFSNNLDLRFSKYDKKDRLHTFDFNIGVDAYTSASSDKIDPNTVSSASSSDQRVYPSLSWNMANAKKHTSWGATGYYSTEFDYESLGLGLNFSKNSKDENREFSIKLNGYMDTWRVILPVELRGHGEPESAPRNSISAAFTLTQVINQRLQVAILAEPAYQEGLLATRYQRVYFTDGSVLAENLPGSRWKFASGVRAHYFVADRLVLRGFYRYYIDEWNLNAHTFNLEAPVKITPLISLSPFYRYYTQQGISYFAPYKENTRGQQFYTSDYDLSTLQSHAFGAGIRLAPANGIFGIGFWNAFELRYEHYIRSTGLVADMVTIGLKFKPDFELMPAIRSLSQKRS